MIQDINVLEITNIRKFAVVLSVYVNKKNKMWRKKINKWPKYVYAYEKMTGHAWSDEFSALVGKFNGIYTSKVFFQIFEEEIFSVWYSVSQYPPTSNFLRQSSVMYHVQNISWLMFHRHVNVKQRKQVLLRLHLSSWHFRWNKSYLPSCFWSQCYFLFLKNYISI